jgi:hypothetical protein
MLEKHGNEGALPGLELPPHEIGLSARAAGAVLRRHLRAFHALCDAFDFFDDSVGEGNNSAERLELFFHPRRSGDVSSQRIS